MRPIAGGLCPAKRQVDVSARRLRVDVEYAGFKLIHASFGRRESAGEYRGREAKTDRVRPLDRLVDRAKPIQGANRSEYLLPRDEVLVPDILEESRRDEVGPLSGPLATSDDPAS